MRYIFERCTTEWLDYMVYPGQHFLANFALTVAIRRSACVDKENVLYHITD